MTDDARLFKLFIGCLIGYGLLASILYPFVPPVRWLVESVGILGAGWIGFLKRTLPEVEVDTAGCIQAVVTILILTFVLHLFLRWFGTAKSREDEKSKVILPSKWKLRWTLVGVTFVAILFISGMAFSAIALHIKMIAESPDPMININRGAAGSAASYSNLNKIGKANLWHEAVEGKLPQGTIQNEFGQAQHGWMIQLTPYMDRKDIYDRYDFDRPWNDPANAELMRTPIAHLNNIALHNAPERDENGFCLSHYATNSRVIGPHPAMSLEDITDGQGTTLLAGEVNHDFLPWGHPRNYSDPAIGLQVPGGFGGAGSNCTKFIFCDGHVSTIVKDIDPAVLKALTTPAAGDDPGDSDGY